MKHSILVEESYGPKPVAYEYEQRKNSKFSQIFLKDHKGESKRQESTN